MRNVTQKLTWLFDVSPQNLLAGMNKFLAQLEITFRRDPNNFRPRINKLNSIKVNMDFSSFTACVQLKKLVFLSGCGTKEERQLLLPGRLNIAFHWVVVQYDIKLSELSNTITTLWIHFRHTNNLFSLSLAWFVTDSSTEMKAKPEERTTFKNET